MSLDEVIRIFNSALYDRVTISIRSWSPCNLDDSVFPGDIDFARFADTGLPLITFNHALFEHKMTFGCRSNDQEVHKSILFNGGASFYDAHFKKELLFESAVFNNEVSFENVRFSGRTSFKYVTFAAKADFKRIFAEHPDGVQFVGLGAASVRNVVFVGYRAKLFIFRDCTWPPALGLEVHYNCAQETQDGNERHYLKCEELYRYVKKAAMERGDQLLASRWHFRELLMRYRRTIGKWWTPRGLPRALSSLLFWYRQTSGFGEQPRRAAIVLAALVGAVLAIMAVAGLSEASGGSGPGPILAIGAQGGALFDICSCWERLYAGFQHLLFVTGPRFSPTDPAIRTLLLLLTRALIPLQFALFAMAVRNVLRR